MGRLSSITPTENEKTIAVIVNGDTTVEPHETFYVDLSLVGGSATLADDHGLGTILSDDATISIDDTTAVEGQRTVTFLEVFAPPSGSPPLILPCDIEFGPDGNIYVNNYASSSVLRYDATTGAFIDTFVAPFSGGFQGSSAMAFGPDGNVYLASWIQDRVVVFDGADGTLLREFVAPGYGGLNACRGLVFGPDGDLYVASMSPHRVLRYDGTTGEFLGEFVTAGSGGLNSPRGVTFGADGNLYVAGGGSKHVLRYDGATGAFIDAFATEGNPNNPQNLTFGPDGDLYLSSWGDERVLRYDGTTGEYIDDFVPSSSGGPNRPWGLAFDSEDTLFVVCHFSDQVLRYYTNPHAAITVTLSNSSAVPVTVDFTTTNVTAAAGSDYEATSGTLTFAPGETSKTIMVPTIDDVFAELDETFLVSLSNPTGVATLADSQGVATIVDDNDPLLPGDFSSDGTVDSDDFGIWQGGFGMTNGADLYDGDADGDGDVDGADFLSWQQNFGSSTASGSGSSAALASDSDGSGEASDSPSLSVAEGSGNSADRETGRARNGSASGLNSPGLSISASQLAPIMSANGCGANTSQQRGGLSEPEGRRLPTRTVTLEEATDDQASHCGAADIAVWTLPLPIPKTTGSTTSWLDLPQFQLHDATQPFQRDRAVDAVMSRLDEHALRWSGEFPFLPCWT